MIPWFGNVTIIGTGLLGASLGLALRRSGYCDTVTGAGRSQSTLESAKECGAIDHVSLDINEACRTADLVVICTPANLVIPTMDAIREACSSHATVTDVASTKAAICAHAMATWPTPRRFVGSHPMAGSEKSGPRHASPDLYKDRYVIVEDDPGIAHDAVRTVRLLWESVGARCVTMAPVSHDQQAARTSHTPHLAAACLALLAAPASETRPLTGPGFRDTTRIAKGGAEVWRDICLTNRESILAALDDFAGHLDAFREAIAVGDGDAVEALLTRARAARLEFDDD